MMGSGYRRASAEKWEKFASIVAVGLRAEGLPVHPNYERWEADHAR
jgi:hypothetical protein